MGKRTIKKILHLRANSTGSTEKRSPKRDQNRASGSAKPTLSKKRTTRTESAPRGQQHRLHLKRGQHTATETSLEVTTNDLTNEGTQKGSRMKSKVPQKKKKKKKKKYLRYTTA